MYNLTVDGEHEYFAEGVLVSNCDAARYAIAEILGLSYRHKTPASELLARSYQGPVTAGLQDTSF